MSKVNFEKLGDDFAPRVRKSEEGFSADQDTSSPERWRSREVPSETQLSIKGATSVIERFKSMCDDERYPYYIQLHRLMNVWEGKDANDGVKTLKKR